MKSSNQKNVASETPFQLWKVKVLREGAINKNDTDDFYVEAYGFEHLQKVFPSIFGLVLAAELITNFVPLNLTSFIKHE